MKGSSALVPLVIGILFQAIGGWSGALKAEDENPTKHLFFVKRMESSKQTLEFRSTPPYYEVVQSNEYRKKKTYLVKVGEAFGFGDQFAVREFVQKLDHDPVSNTDKDVSQLWLHDKIMNKDIKLVTGVPFFLDDPVVMLEWDSKTTESIKVEKGDTFRIPGRDDTTYRLLDVHDDTAVIAPLLPDGSHVKEIVIARRSAP